MTIKTEDGVYAVFNAKLAKWINNGLQAYRKGFREVFRVRTNEIKNVLAKKRRMDAGIPTLIDDSGGTRDQQGK